MWICCIIKAIILLSGIELTSDVRKPVRKLKRYGRISGVFQFLCAQIWYTVQFGKDDFQGVIMIKGLATGEKRPLLTIKKLVQDDSDTATTRRA